MTAAKKWWHRNSAAAVSVAGVAAAALGGALALTQPPAVVGLQDGGLRVGDALLPPIVGGVYGGNGRAAVVITTQPGDGSVIANADGVSRGQRVRGRCRLVRQDTVLHEGCTFTIGDKSFTADDRLDTTSGGGWQRRYADGQRVVIAIPPNGAVTPVPFPIGK